MIKHKKVEPDDGEEPGVDHNDGNGEALAEILNTVRFLANKQAESDDRLTDLEKSGGRSQAQVQMMKMLYQTERQYLPGLARISRGQARPFATALTLNAIDHPDVISGKVSLTEEFFYWYLLFTRSIEGVHLNKGRELAMEQAKPEGGDMGSELDLTKDMG
jgi:hypothetical protein